MVRIGGVTAEDAPRQTPSADMADSTASPPDSAEDDESDLENEPPDESVLLGAEGVEQELLAELARAEAELSDPNAPDYDPDAEGAQV